MKNLKNNIRGKIFFPNYVRERRRKKLLREKRKMITAFVLSLVLSLGEGAGAVDITSTEDFIHFVNDVNNKGSTYSGTTVFLDSDISLSGELVEPIGKDSSKQFRGTFDGQGHVIRGLKICSSLQYVGLFGYSDGLKIKNFVLDETCSVTNSVTNSDNSHNNAYTGGIIGYCTGSSGSYAISEVVNMANIKFNGEVSSNTSYLGGIAGRLFLVSNPITYTYECSVKNCVNYGTIMESGRSYYSSIGGIVGEHDFYGYKTIQNCANYGEITQGGTISSTITIGGIIGVNSYGDVVNCLSVGKITASKLDFVGSIMGFVRTPTRLIHCYFGSDVGLDKVFGSRMTNQINISEIPGYPSALDLDLANNLNDYALDNGWGKWVLLHPTGGKINNMKRDVFVTPVNCLPYPVKDGHIFLHWCEDENFKTKYDPKMSDTTELTDLYAQFGVEVTVNFDGTGGRVNPSSKGVITNSVYGDLPTPSKEGFTFIGWFTDNNDEVTSERIVNIANDHTLYAKWVINKYTIKFEPNGGSECPDITHDYDTPFTLPEPSRTGYTFVHWCSDSSLTTEYTNRVIEARNVTLYAKWTANNYTVTFNAAGGSVTLNSKRVTFDSAYGDLPTPNKEGFTFLGWFTDNNKEVTSKKIVNIANDHTLYAQWVINKYTISFESNGGSECPDITQDYSTPLVLPEPNKAGYTFVHWCSDSSLTIEYTNRKMEARNATLFAKWAANNYTVTFNAMGGNVTLDSKRVTFNSAYGDLPIPQNKIGFSFLGWFTENNESVTSGSIVNIPNDHTLYAQWEEILTKQVEIVFETKDLSDDKIKETIEKYTNDDFTITRMESEDELRVIIEFKDAKKAEKFVRSIEASADSDGSKFIRVEFVTKELFYSLSFLAYPILLFIIFLL